KEGIYNQVCFHSQQATEKSLKALIEEKSKVIKEHRFSKLSKVCKALKYELDKFQTKLEFLDKFYTSTRYPFIIGMLPQGSPTESDAKTALEFAEEFYSFARYLLGDS
ncbi:MAG: HEPN domain-containing protein, partial [Candidatus Omnitrophota bacterium]